RIRKLNFDSMSEEGKVDYLLFKNHLEHELRQLDIEARQQIEIAPFVPFAQTIVDLEESRRRMEPVDAAKAAGTLTNIKKQIADTSEIIGDPIGRDALLSELQFEMIPYTPEELIAIANKEMAWCENEMKKASRDLGFGDDWKKALEHVKNLYVEPGKQPEMIRD